MLLPERTSRPDVANIGAASDRVGNLKSGSTLTPATDLLADLDALAESLRARFAVQVTINDAGNRRTFLYRSSAAAERCVERARGRGRSAHVTLVQFMPVGVVSGLVAR